MKGKVDLYRRFQVFSKRCYWNELVKRFNRLAYLNHIVETTFDDSGWGEEIEEILSVETETWRKRGLKVHLIIQDIPLPEGRNSHFSAGACGSFANWESLRHFKKKVEDAEYERDRRKREGREIGVKYFTAVVAALAALASLANLYLSALKK